MLGFSWSELLLVIIVTVLAVGPKQLPEVLFGLGRLVRRLQYMRFAMSKQFDDFMEAADLHEIRKAAQMKPADFLNEPHDEAGHDMANHEQNPPPAPPAPPQPAPAPNEIPSKKSDDEK